MGYKDVPDDYIYQKAIRFTQVQGIMSGVDTEGNFAPKGKMKLSELCVLIAHLFDFDYDSYRIKNSSEVPKWVFPYFMACRSYKVMPDSFENRIVLDEYATIDDLYLIFSLAQEHLIPLEFKSQFDIPEKASDSDLTREICAYLIYCFCESISKTIFDEFGKKEISLLECTIKVYSQHSWIDFFYDPTSLNEDLYQIYYLLGRISSQSLLKLRFDAMSEICKMREAQFSQKIVKPIYHYTTLKTLEILTKPEVRFRLSNTAYLNDPQEGFLGRTLLTELASKKYNSLSEFLALFKTNVYSASSCFTASFIKTKDSLPMWIQYGDKGSGCCLELDPNDFCDKVYTVIYCKDTIEHFFSGVLDILTNYKEKCSNISYSSDPVFRYAKMILLQCCYLYKDPAYKHEHEVRIMRFLPPQAAKVEEEPRSGELFPRVYCDTPLQTDRRSNIGLRFSSIILGPTVANPEQIAVAVAQRGYSADIIQKSEISFR